MHQVFQPLALATELQGQIAALAAQTYQAVFGQSIEERQRATEKAQVYEAQLKSTLLTAFDQAEAINQVRRVNSHASPLEMAERLIYTITGPGACPATCAASTPLTAQVYPDSLSKTVAAAGRQANL